MVQLLGELGCSHPHSLFLVRLGFREGMDDLRRAGLPPGALKESALQDLSSFVDIDLSGRCMFEGTDLFTRQAIDTVIERYVTATPVR